METIKTISKLMLSIGEGHRHCNNTVYIVHTIDNILDTVKIFAYHTDFFSALKKFKFCRYKPLMSRLSNSLDYFKFKYSHKHLCQCPFIFNHFFQYRPCHQFINNFFYTSISHLPT